MRRMLLIGAALLAWPASVAAQEPSVKVTGTLSAGGRAVDNDTGSSKLTEYRDLKDDAFLPRLTLDVFDPARGWFFDFSGSNVSLDDQRLHARGGRLGSWSLGLDWTDVPHDLSNKAQTPYFRSAPGVFEVAANIPITFKKLATSAP